jgi:hypothetical protein
LRAVVPASVSSTPKQIYGEGLIVFYSRNGSTEKMALAVAEGGEGGGRGSPVAARPRLRMPHDWMPNILLPLPNHLRNADAVRECCG